jgi:hypothetical protein
MADPAPVRRTLRMHSAHRIIGVRGFRTAAGGYGQTEDFSTENPEPQPPDRNDSKPQAETWDHD